MTELRAFVSVGATAGDKQESFVRALEDRLRSESIVPHTVGRNTFGSDAPLKTVTQLMDECSGVVVVALERMFFPSGIEKRGGPKEAVLQDVKLPTPWNQIEAAMAYSRGLPLLVIVEGGLKSEGLLERGYDWYVQYVRLEPEALTTNEFNGVLSGWKKKMLDRAQQPAKTKSPTQLTVAELIGGLTPVQLWSVLAAIAALLAGAFALGAKLSVGL